MNIEDLLFWASTHMWEEEYLQLLTMETEYIIEYIIEKMGGNNIS